MAPAAPAPRTPFFRLDNCVIDDYAREMGALGVAIYAALQRYANRTTGECWPSVATLARVLGLSKKTVQTYLHRLARLGLIGITPRQALAGDPASNLYTVYNPTQPVEIHQHRARGSVAVTAPPQAIAAVGRETATLPLPENTIQIIDEREDTASPLKEQDLLLKEEKKRTSTDDCCLVENSAEDEEEKAPTTALLPPLQIGAPCTTPGHPHSSPIAGLMYCQVCWTHWPVPLVEQPPVPLGRTEQSGPAVLSPQRSALTLPLAPVGLRIVPQRQPWKPPVSARRPSVGASAPRRPG